MGRPRTLAWTDCRDRLRQYAILIDEATGKERRAHLDPTGRDAALLRSLAGRLEAWANRRVAGLRVDDASRLAELIHRQRNTWQHEREITADPSPEARIEFDAAQMFLDGLEEVERWIRSEAERV